MKDKGRYLAGKIHVFAEFLYTYRILIGIGVLILSVVFEINGSSLGCWELFAPGGETGRILSGTSRLIRSDEWTVSSSMLASQYNAGFPYFNEGYRAYLTDMFIVYGQPVRDAAVIFRPFHWGYLFLPMAKGLAFYWIGKAVALALVSFELGMVLANGKKVTAFLYAVLVTCSPAVQWWYAVNAFPDMLIYGQAAVLIIANYFQTENDRIKILLGVLLALVCGAYALVFYPAWQIPFAYIFGGLAIWIIIRNRGKIVWKKDGCIAAMTAVILFAGLAYVVLKSSETIKAVLNTAYPGDRCETGGGGLRLFLRYMGNLMFPFKETSDYGIVAPEWSVMFDFFPMGWILAAIVWFKEKRKDFLLFLLAAIQALFLFFIVFGMSESAAKITLLSQSTAGRCFIAAGFINILLLIRALSLTRFSMKLKSAAVCSGLLAYGIVMLSKRYMYGAYIGTVEGIFLTVLLCAMFLGILCMKKNRYLCVILTVTVLGLSGGFVNPIRTGIYDVSVSSLGHAVREINDRQEGIWIDATGGGMMGDFLGAAGVSVINSTNTYPVLERWKILDPEGKYEDIYNRYAHIEIELQNAEKTYFSLPVQDAVHINLNTDDLPLLNVRYILTKKTMRPDNTDKVRFIRVYEDDLYSIYQVETLEGRDVNG